MVWSPATGNLEEEVGVPPTGFSELPYGTEPVTAPTRTVVTTARRSSAPGFITVVGVEDTCGPGFGVRSAG